MAKTDLSAPKAILLAVQAAINADISGLRFLIARYHKAFRTDVVLRILLSFLPESLETSEYVPFVQELASGRHFETSDSEVDISAVEDISDAEADEEVRKLHLLPLTLPSTSQEAPSDPLILFLICRAYRVDDQTGLITQLPELVVPFLDHSEYLRTWMISSLLPLLRLSYEYYPQDTTIQTMKDFEALNDHTALELLLSKTGKSGGIEGNNHTNVGRDLRGLVGPWLFGDTHWKRRRLQRDSNFEGQTVLPLDQELDAGSDLEDDKCAGWEEVFRWITSQASTSWSVSVEAIEHWDGPGDVDLGGYEDGSVRLEERLQQKLERQYARAALAAAYLIPEASVEALTGAQRILTRLVNLLDLDKIPTLPAAAALLLPVSNLEDGILVPENATFLRAAMLGQDNPLTAPAMTSISILGALITSAFILTRNSVPCTVRKAGELSCLQDEKDQMSTLRALIQSVENGPKGDDKYWIRARNELLWLRDWGHGNGAEDVGRGILGSIQRNFLETQILQALLANTRYTLASSIYEDPAQKILEKKMLQDAVITAALKAYDNATNANRTRGGVKKCNDILKTFPHAMEGSLASNRLHHLLDVTHSIGSFRLVLKQGEPFTPVALRVHSDPISIIGKILEQNAHCYTKINELIHLGEGMVLAGLTFNDVKGRNIIKAEQEVEQITIAKKRITSMCIDAALTEDDFETAYSYVMNRLSSVASEAQTRTSALGTGESAEPPPLVLDDWSWRAALQAGKYRMNSHTVRPTHLGNASGNPEIRNLEQRMECLSQALRIAPPQTLQGILHVFRRCEEELETKIRQEAEQEAAWDQRADQTTMPGSFAGDPMPTTLFRDTSSALTRTGAEAPMSLIDLTRASAAHAQRSLTAFKSLSGGTTKGQNPRQVSSTAESLRSSGESARGTTGVSGSTIRKRDQLRNAAVGTLASGIGWLINAPMPPQASSTSDTDPDSS
ncbi:MAG: hypothetical protein M1818_004585 [Claussenomyces sp. TS43310]|nr:MAG: hypothetical protein M1818_004585 [Claussenomyces sp. TS43310]